METCTVDGCDRQVRGKGLCQMHYMRWYRYGTTDMPANAKRPHDVPFEEWFWSWFKPNGDCLDWTRTTRGMGYGHVRHEGRMRGTHAVAWILTNGPIPEGMCVLHSCDRPACGNPAHLFLGTNDDNVADKVSKGRQRGAPGERNSGAKLTEHDVRVMRRARECGVSTWAMVQMYGVDKSSVANIISRRTWATV